MGKLVSFFVFLAAFVWTWFLFHSQDKINVGVHAGLQSKLAIMIEDTLKKARPNSFKFKMLSLYTTKIDDNKINAHFSYRYSEPLEDKEISEQTVNGDAVLNRSVSENPEEQKWIVQNVKTDSSVIEFQEGLIIGSGPATATKAVSETGIANPAPEKANEVPTEPKSEEPKKTE
ncbi:MAG: hypothetical protein ACXVAX_04250 [Pseudobdellovibrio sp.]